MNLIERLRDRLVGYRITSRTAGSSERAYDQFLMHVENVLQEELKAACIEINPGSDRCVWTTSLLDDRSSSHWVITESCHAILMNGWHIHIKWIAGHSRKTPYTIAVRDVYITKPGDG